MDEWQYLKGSAISEGVKIDGQNAKYFSNDVACKVGNTTAKCSVTSGKLLRITIPKTDTVSGTGTGGTGTSGTGTSGTGTGGTGTYPSYTGSYAAYSYG
jgi:hypothetical protein